MKKSSQVSPPQLLYIDRRNVIYNTIILSLRWVNSQPVFFLAALQLFTLVESIVQTFPFNKGIPHNFHILSKKTATNSLNYSCHSEFLTDRLNDWLNDPEIKVPQGGIYSELKAKSTPTHWSKWLTVFSSVEQSLTFCIRFQSVGRLYCHHFDTHIQSVYTVPTKHRKESCFPFPHSSSSAAVSMGAQIRSEKHINTRKIISIPEWGEDD